MKNIVLIMIAMLSMNIGKAQWTEIPCPINYLYGSHFINDDTGFLLTGRGYVERTSDGGMTWDSIGTPYFYSWLNAASFLNDSVGYLCGGANFPFPPNSISDLILKTTDGGLSFDSIFGTFTGSDIQAISFADENHGMFLGAFNSYKTDDGGQSIDTLHLPNNSSSTMFGSAVAYVDLQHAYALTNQYISSNPLTYARYFSFSADQGNNWTQSYVDTVSYPRGGLQFLNPQVGFMASDNSLLKTSDGGQNWQAILNTSMSGLQAIHFVNEQTGFITALYGDTSYLYTTLDGGNNWQIEQIDTNFQASHLSITANYIYVSDFGRLFKKAIDSISVGLRPNIALSEIKVYPNPSVGPIHIDVSQEQGLKYELVNHLGQIVQTGRLEEHNSALDLSFLPRGIYTLSIADQYKPLGFSRIVLK